MATFELKLPSMGESVAEATLTSWLKAVGDSIAADESVFEVATDKVDSEVPSEREGVLVEQRFQVNDVIRVGQVVAILQTKNEGEPGGAAPERTAATAEAKQVVEAQMAKAQDTLSTPPVNVSDSKRFYSPLVKSMAKEEGVTLEELETITGTGKEGRVTKNDMIAFLQQHSAEASAPAPAQTPPTLNPTATAPQIAAAPPKAPAVAKAQSDERVPLTRMGKLIAQHMAESVATSAHVQSFIEADVTALVRWRNTVKKAFEAREGEKLTFTPIFMEAVALALKKYPMLNSTLEGYTLVKKKSINLGMAAALPDGNLIVPVIKNADQLSLSGMAKEVNDLARRARNNQLKPDEVQDGTYTVTNVGAFGTAFGTPIINQPQVGILALGAIRKVPAVVETEQGDYIGIRSKLYLSHSYDHRVINGALGGLFIKAIADYLEAWDTKREM